MAYLASEAHVGQARDDGAPYILHPLRTALSLVEELGVSDAALICAALLHDVAEDQDRISLSQIESEIGSRAAQVVRTLTKPPKRGLTHDEVNAVYFRRLERADDDSILVKLADKLDNLRDAVNCPDLRKRRRTAAEARGFYLKLSDSLHDAALGASIRRLIEEAIDRLLRVSGPTAG